MLIETGYTACLSDQQSHLHNIALHPITAQAPLTVFSAVYNFNYPSYRTIVLTDFLKSSRKLPYPQPPTLFTVFLVSAAKLITALRSHYIQAILEDCLRCEILRRPRDAFVNLKVGMEMDTRQISDRQQLETHQRKSPPLQDRSCVKLPNRLLSVSQPSCSPRSSLIHQESRNPKIHVSPLCWQTKPQRDYEANSHGHRYHSY